MRSFAQMLANIRRSDDVLREAVAEAATYILIQYHKNGRKVDGAGVSLRAQFVAALPAWLQKEAGRWALDSGKRIPEMGEREAEMRADAFIGTAFASQEEKRRIARENRAAKAERKAAEQPAVTTADATPEVAAEVPNPIIEGEVVRSTTAAPYALCMGDNEVELTAEEAQALLRNLMAMRSAATVRLAA